ncbi:hypothetical protein CAY35_02580 [Pseudoglutamicibacter cumminsii]|uniref:Uncharacterized protein n=1 Tax=Pseudoglutamicibacter cumminsii TaxID=156979 RepID=A0ABX5L9K7_9MICC|nr:hypothetical protein CAY35_02580 [Pseudoglutamicibacter cumminsii]
MTGSRLARAAKVVRSKTEQVAGFQTKMTACQKAPLSCWRRVAKSRKVMDSKALGRSNTQLPL